MSAFRTILLAVCSLLLGAAACSAEVDGPRTGRMPLLDHGNWELVPFAEDPFASEYAPAGGDAVGLPAAPTCSALAVLTEGGMLEIDTDNCSFVTVRTQTLDTIRVGETQRLLFWHLYLFADPPAQGVAELRVDGKTWWRLEVEIPAQEAIYKPKSVADRAIPAGSEVLFHVHNHGANSWRLLDWTTGD
ncbi:MAG: hypothetical protein H6747_03370 [Deltaproteobacteria bacterium]|nr:hypothetical protein [Deltaproteobacteria bacterium]